MVQEQPTAICTSAGAGSASSENDAGKRINGLIVEVQESSCGIERARQLAHQALPEARAREVTA